MAALVRKEGRQVVRDPSSIAIGIVLPVILILLFGYGLSLDMKDIRVALVLDDRSAEATEMAAGFQMSRYFITTYVNSMEEARELMLNRKADAILHVQSDFSRRLALGNAEVQLLVHGSDANRARIIQAYSEAALGAYLGRRAAAGEPVSAGTDQRSEPALVQLGQRKPLVSRAGADRAGDDADWRDAHRAGHGPRVGTRDARSPVRHAGPLRRDSARQDDPLFPPGHDRVCPVRGGGEVPVPRSAARLDLGADRGLDAVLLVALGIGLVISALVKSQFVASQVAILVTFLPAMMLSGFLFDLRSMPAPLRLLTYALPARYYVALLQTMFLAGDVWPVILPNTAVLGVMAVLLAILTRGSDPQTLE